MTNFRKTTSGIHYHRTGNADQAIVFVHGFLEDLRMWKHFIHRVPRYSVIKLDLPGFGQSSVISETSIVKYADAVHQVLLQEKIKQVILVGHSMGGYTALAFAKKYPSFLKGLSVFHSQPYADTKENKAKRTKSVKFVETHGASAYVHATIPNLFAKAFVKKQRSIVDAVIDYGIENDEVGIINALNAMKNRPDTSDVLQKIKCPVQFIIGKEDQAIPVENSLRQTTLPTISDVQILQGIGHMGHLEATRKTQKMVRNFIRFVDRV